MIYGRHLIVVALCVSGTARAAESAGHQVIQQISASGEWQALYNTDVRFFAFHGTRGYPAPNEDKDLGIARGRGSQVYVPTAFQLVGTPTPDWKLEITLRGGYVWSQQASRGLSGTYSGPTDTVASATATLLTIPGLQPFLSINANLPTGRSVLTGSSANARLDPDLVDVPAFGQGWNIGPSVGANIPLTENLILTLGAGYTHLGQFTHDEWDAYSETRARVRTDPGESASVNASVAYAQDAVAVQLAATFTRSGTTRRDETPIVRAGDSFGVAGAFAYAWSDTATTTITAQAARTERNEVLDSEAGALIREAANSNSNVFKLGLEHGLKLAPEFSIGPTASLLYRDNNAYAPSTAQFVTAKKRVSVGAVLQFAPTERWSVNARVERIWTRENARQEVVVEGVNLPGTARPELSYQGWAASAGVSTLF